MVRLLHRLGKIDPGDGLLPLEEDVPPVIRKGHVDLGHLLDGIDAQDRHLPVVRLADRSDQEAGPPLGGQPDSGQTPVPLEAEIRSDDSFLDEEAEAGDAPDLLVAVSCNDEIAFQRDVQIPDGLKGKNKRDHFSLVVVHSPAPDVSPSTIVGALSVAVVLGDLAPEGIHGPSFRLDGGGIDMGARMENRLPFLSPVAGDHVAPRAFEPHDLRPLQLQILLRGVVDLDLAPQGAELFRQDFTEGVIILPRRNLGVDTHQLLQEFNHLFSVVFDVRKESVFILVHNPLLWI